MNATVQSMPSAAANTKPLWAAVGVLGFAVVAMGASLVYVQTRPADGHVALAAGIMARLSVSVMPISSQRSSSNRSRLTLWSGQAG